MKQSRSTPGKQSAPARSPKTASETFRVAGISYYPDAIKGLARLNPDWKLSPEEIFASDKTGQKIYKCKFTTSPVQLIPEPENPHDPNTIAVTIAGEKIGYVPRETAPLIGSILKKCEVKSIACGIIGGQYKVVDDNLNIETGKSSTTITVKITYYEPTVSSAPAEIISPPKGSFLELLLCWLLGYLGVHKFYRKKKGMGFLYLFTIGLFGIGWIGDSIYLTIRFISSLRGKAPTKKQKYGSYIAVALCFLVLGSCGGNKGPATETIPTSLPTESVSIQESKIATIPSETEIITETTATEDILTTGQKNALKAAES